VKEQFELSVVADDISLHTAEVGGSSPAVPTRCQKDYARAAQGQDRVSDLQADSVSLSNLAPQPGSAGPPPVSKT